MTELTSRSGTLAFGPGRPTVLINDQLRVMDQSPQVLDELRRGRFDKLLDLARWGQQVGTDMVDVLINHVDLDEEELLPRLVVALSEDVGCPISLDSRNPRALDAALQALHPHKGLINSVSGEPEVLEALLPIARKHGAAIVGMPMGRQHGLPRTLEARLEEVRALLTATDAAGIPRQDVVIDAVCLASAAEPDSMRVTLETLRAVQAMGLSTILGIGNAGFGMPEPTRIDLAYLIAAVPWGLNAALVDPATPGLIETVRAVDFLAGNDPTGAGYLRQYRARQKARPASGATP
jgi:5-methyltetrahydrofolate--homocysteine methyltransferase